MKYLFLALRPKQWTKNLLVFMALVFSVNQYWSPLDLGQAGAFLTAAAAAFVVLCLASSSHYLINDLVDLEGDREHPQKRLRPLPSGKVKPGHALMAAFTLMALALLLGFWLSRGLGLILVLYLALMLGYTFFLRRMVILDVFAIAGGFVLRAVAGAVVLAIPISPWLYIVTALGALFIAFTKRKQELVLLADNAARHRSTLQEYTPKLLDELIGVVAPATVMAYSLYTFSAESLPRNHAMMLTIPFVLYGVFRYLYLSHVRDQGGTPEEVLLQDKPLLLTVLLWALTAGALLFFYHHG
ncbi:MAG: decaprenyl-phosphate phosphoribosyltransferase [Chloroflexota bacterium]|nr:decaprenyl-phosphate phosphoribosyltransferase [Chloroflexota bacterium]